MEGYGPDLTLPSGRNANVRLSEPTGRDLLTAARMVKPNEPPQAFSMAMIAVLTRIDGNAVAYEDVQALSLSDILALMSATGLDSPGPYIGADTFVALVGRGFALAELMVMTARELGFWVETVARVAAAERDALRG